MMSEYSGNVTTDASGNAVATLPDYFEALNKDYRYQLTVMGQFAQAIVADGVKDNKFIIKTDKPNVAVSWLVMGTRQDPYYSLSPKKRAALALLGADTCLARLLACFARLSCCGLYSTVQDQNKPAAAK